MAKGFLQKLLGASPKVPPEVEAAQVELSSLEQKKSAVASAAALLRAVLSSMYAEPVKEEALSLTKEQAALKLQGGVPLLRGECVSLDWPGFRRRWQGICQTVQRHQNAETARHLAGLVRSGKLQPEEMLAQVLAGQPVQIYARVDEVGGDAGLCAMILRFTLFPVLSSFCQELAHHLSGTSWQQGYCPMCGSWPLLGEFRGLEQIRFLRCGLCSAGWEFPRLRCAHCGNSDHQSLGYYHVEGEENRFRAATCEECRSYVKMVSTLRAMSGPQLLVADVETMHLDLVMAERGYGVPG